jgi:hypothetical protein
MGLNPDALYLDLLNDLEDFVGDARLFDRRFSLEEIDNPRVWAARKLTESFYKKYVDKIRPTADQLALDKFLASNERCKVWEKTSQAMLDDLLYGTFENECYKFFNRVCQDIRHYDDIFSRGRFGPGASVGSRGTDFYTKSFSSELTVTSLGLSHLWVDYVRKLPIWNEAESNRFDSFGEPYIVKGSRLSFVPKSSDVSRCICIEPGLNMFAQLGLGSILEDHLVRSFGIDLSIQPDYNRTLARIGSIEGQYFTIDLSSASDSISLKMLRSFLPKRFLFWLEKFRSPYVEIPSGDQVELSMVSSMGNGFTFPLQTAIFCCVVSSVYKVLDIKLEKPSIHSHGNFAVFGDDIIGVSESYRLMVRLLSMLGFTVNEEKSFNEGLFRESCGYDFYRGRYVRGVYIKTLRTPQARAVVINRLNHWSAATGIYLPRTVGRLIRSLRSHHAPLVPLYENDDAGIKVPLSLIKNLRIDKDTQSIFYRKWESVATRLRVTDSGIKVGRGKPRILNIPGLLLSFLHGSLRNHTISIRTGGLKYGRRRGVSSNWNWLPASGLTAVDGWRLENAITFNFIEGDPRG